VTLNSKQKKENSTENTKTHYTA